VVDDKRHLHVQEVLQEAVQFLLAFASGPGEWFVCIPSTL
jgi:hypothetical protein